jgi:hypothetical protein
MLAINLQAAKNLAIVVAIGFVVLSLVMGMIIKNVMAKLVMVLLMLGLALGVWTQRKALDTCAEAVKADLAAGTDNGTACTFFGTQIDIPLIDEG